MGIKTFAESYVFCYNKRLTQGGGLIVRRRICQALAFILIFSAAVTAYAHGVAQAEDPNDILVLVNRDYALSNCFQPDDLIPVGGGQLMRKRAANAFLDMQYSMNQEGLFLTVRSGFRSYNTQRVLFNNAVRNWGLASAERWIARPGHSEHQTGLAVDIVQYGFTGSPLSNARFQNTRHFAWLQERAHTYGFIMRYPREYEYITGVAFEPWHWRYIGTESAAYMREHGFAVFEKYIEHRTARDGFLSEWAQDLVSAAIAEGLVPRNLQHSYTNAITRAEFAALVVALYENKRDEITGRVTFADADDINVQKAAYIGVVAGVGCYRFAPDYPLSREHAAVMLARLAVAVGQPLPIRAPTFADNAQISSWARNGVGQIQAAGVMDGTGNNNFAPRAAFTREQSIVTIMRLFALIAQR